MIYVSCNGYVSEQKSNFNVLKCLCYNRTAMLSVPPCY